MCCACINPWVFYTEMLIIIIVLEHFYLPKRLPRTCSPTMEREQWENRSCIRKGKKNCNLFRKAPSVFIQNFSWLQSGEKQAWIFYSLPAHIISKLMKGIPALQFFEELKWKDKSSEAGIFSLPDWTVTGLAVSRQVFFLWMKHFYWHFDVTWEFI